MLRRTVRAMQRQAKYGPVCPNKPPRVTRPKNDELWWAKPEPKLLPPPPPVSPLEKYKAQKASHAHRSQMRAEKRKKLATEFHAAILAAATEEVIATKPKQPTLVHYTTEDAMPDAEWLTWRRTQKALALKAKAKARRAKVAANGK